MKNLTFLLATIVMLFTYSEASAQLEAGHIRIGPKFEFASIGDGNDDTDNAISLTAGVDAGYMLINNLDAGLLLNVDYTSSSNDNNSTVFTVGPNVRYAIPVSETMYVPLSLGYGFVTGSNGDTDISGGSFLARVGVEFLPYEKLGFGYTVGYTTTDATRSTEVAGQTLEVDSKGSVISLGMHANIYFTR